MNSFLGLGTNTNWLDIAQQGFSDFLSFQKVKQQNDFLQSVSRGGQSGSVSTDPKTGQPVYSIGGVGLSGAPLLIIGVVLVFVLLIARR